MLKEKIVDIDIICKYLWKKIYKYLEEKGGTVIWLAEVLNKNQPYINNLLNGKRSTSNIDIYKRMALTVWMNEDEFENLLKDAKKHEFLETTWSSLDLQGLKLSDLKLALSRDYWTKDEQVLDDIMSYAKFKIEQGDTDFLKKIIK